MHEIDKATVKHVALLSRLYLSDEEVAVYSKQLAAILTYIHKLDELDLKDVPPTSHVLPTLKNVDRPDELKPSLDITEFLSHAPAHEDDFFKIPKVIEGK